jgi:hypothetical protein
MKRLCIVPLLFCLQSAFGQNATLLKGAIYYDSQVAMKEAIAYALLNDEDSISDMTKIGHISSPTKENQNVVVIVVGAEPDSFAEFTFLNGPTTYWTLTRNLHGGSQQAEQPKTTPTPSPSPSPSTRQSDREILGLPGESHHHLVSKRKVKPKAEKDEDDGSGRKKIWHMVNGHHKWYYAPYADKAPRAVPVQPTQ